MRNEELAKLNRVVLKYEVKDSTERSDFAAVELARNVVGANSVRPLLRICCDFRIVGERRNFCSTEMRQPVRRGNAVVVIFLMPNY